MHDSRPGGAEQFLPGPAMAALVEAIGSTSDDNDWLAVFDDELRCIHVERGAYGALPERLLGLRDDPAAAWRCEAPDTRKLVGDVLATGDPHEAVRLYDDPRCGERAFEFHARPLHDRGAVVGALVRCAESTGRRMHSRASRLQQRILESMSEGVLVVAPGGQIRLTNPACDALFGYRTGELTGQPLAQVCGALAATLAPLGADEREAMRDAALVFEARRRDGAPIAVSCTRRQLRVANDEQWLIVVRDVTDQRKLERELLETERRERERIARDLHDGFGQELTGVALLLRGLAVDVEHGRAGARERIEELVGIVNGMIGSTRQMASDLLDATIPDGDLARALAALAARSAQRSGLDVRFEAQARLAVCPTAPTVTELYRIAQEATTNALRHSGARRITIRLQTTASGIVLAIDDDGAGLAPEAEARSGLGLRIMRFRARSLGAELTIARLPAGGTRVECRVPYGFTGR